MLDKGSKNSLFYPKEGKKSILPSFSHKKQYMRYPIFESNYDDEGPDPIMPGGKVNEPEEENDKDNIENM